MRYKFNNKFLISALTLWSLVVVPIAASAQTRISMPKNKYKIADELKAGNQAAGQVERQFPLLNDSITQNYVENVGRRLVDSIPPEFRQPEFNYRFKVVNARDINAFALPGGPMYVNRGMIEAAKNEGEMAGVMAHEISHVALRHATAQATKQSSIGNQLGTIGLILGGAIFGGQAGAQAGAIAATAWQTKYSRDYETQADVLGSQIMADAGYDPRDLANMFRTIAQQGGGRAPEWLSSHPDPGNRYNNINREAGMLNVSPNPIKITRDFSRVRERLGSMPRARSMAEIEQEYKRTGGTGQSPTAGGRYSTNVSGPSTRVRAYNAGNVISFNVPDNWREFSSGGDVQFAPEGAYGDQGITHGVMVGTSSAGGGLQQATQDYVNAILEGNSYLRQRTGFSRTTVGGRQAYTTILAGRSPVTNRNEVVTVYTTQLRNGSLLYIDTVAPEEDSYQYNSAFRRLINSVRIAN
ncbi:MAG TPA: M48 family metallopeptidase [Pyrinomonadaceae bacterium]|nr:M48 family metallopeptidase [Pyrinomonadaceae bacterium]